VDATRFRAILDALHLRHSDVARMLEIENRSARRFASGDAAIPPAIAEWLELMLDTRPLPPTKARAKEAQQT
jgi:hypothetical protein